jgi:VanZ family protein
VEDVSRGATPDRQRRLSAWLLPAGLYVAITVQSSFTIHMPVIAERFQDKILHAVVFGLLGALLARAVSRGSTRQPSALVTVVIATTVAGLLGGLDEVHQLFVPGRSADVYDALADVVGAALGASAYTVGARLWAWRTREA